VRMPNANAPNDARINIAKSSKFAIATASPIMCVYGRTVRAPPPVEIARAGKPDRRHCDCRRLSAALTLISVAK
jgi:hypothetical protein